MHFVLIWRQHPEFVQECLGGSSEPITRVFLASRRVHVGAGRGSAVGMRSTASAGGTGREEPAATPVGRKGRGRAAGEAGPQTAFL